MSNDFQPHWSSPPGDTIADIMEERNFSLAEFAHKMGQTTGLTRELLQGRIGITTETAQELERLIGGSTAFWVTREAQYRADLARLQAEKDLSEKKWLSELPVKDMIKFGWIESAESSIEKATACLRFFGVPDIEVWRETYSRILEAPSFRTSSSFDSQPGAVATWLRKGEIDGDSIACKSWNAENFQQVLSGIRSLTRKRDPRLFLPELKRRCAECGVAVVVVRTPSGCHASGATYFLSPIKAMLLLSFRYLSDDHFWFTFFHEAGHLLLHEKSLLFLEGIDTSSTQREEDEANEFAARSLIPPEYQAALLRLHVDGREIIRFARHVGVSPGIIVGQLQHIGQFKRNQLNNLKTRFTWGEE